MLVSHPKRFIYTKTAKTAGTSIEMLFEPFCTEHHAAPEAYRPTHWTDETVSEFGIVGLRGSAPKPKMTYWNHMPAAQIKALVGDEVWDGYFKFCAIRDPFDKVVSWFFHCLQAGRIRITGVDDPAEAVRQMEMPKLRQLFGAWLRHKPILPNDRDKYVIDGQLVMDDFVRYECLNEDLKRICDRLEVPFEQLDIRMKADTRIRPEPWQDYYDDASAQIVAEHYRFELEQFGYARETETAAAS